MSHTPFCANRAHQNSSSPTRACSAYSVRAWTYYLASPALRSRYATGGVRGITGYTLPLRYGVVALDGEYSSMQIACRRTRHCRANELPSLPPAARRKRNTTSPSDSAKK